MPKYRGPGPATQHRGMLTLERLRVEVGEGTIDTVVLAFTDMQGRLQGKRLSAEFFLDEVAEHFSEGCNYLLAVPGRHRVPVHGVHLHVDREQVVAAFREVLGHLVEEELRRQPLALQAALHVGEGQHDGVDRAVADLDPQALQGQHAAVLRDGPGTPVFRHWHPIRLSAGEPAPGAGQLASSCSMAASSSGVPCTRGPVNQFLAETAQ